MGVIAIGGLATSTFLTLLVVPVFYTFVAQLQGALVRQGTRLLTKLRPVAKVSDP
jgi:hypothetical protein